MECECEICKNNKPFDLPKEIIEAAINGNLVIFGGAGISTEKKTVLPFTFYSSIKEELGETDDGLSFCDLMQRYCSAPDGRKKLLQRIRERFDYIKSFPELESMATTFHKELSDIYLIKTIITTNWDTYFEDYCGAVAITIPEDVRFFDFDSRFVIKIHGSINNISTIVATTDDYDRCYKTLQNGAVGGVLKSILATKTVVFVGFSFGDDDLRRIMDLLRSEMGELYPHLYFVTLDTALAEKINYRNATFIITDGTFFLHNLKLELIRQGILASNCSKELVDSVYCITQDYHERIASADLLKYPETIYTLAYQDGIIHAIERFYENRTGDYHIQGMIEKTVRNYEHIVEKCHQAGNFWDEAYFEGYTNGLLLLGISEVESEKELLSSFPYLYLPNAKKALAGMDDYYEELERVMEVNDEYNQYARQVIHERLSEGLVVHHPLY